MGWDYGMGATRADVIRECCEGYDRYAAIRKATSGNTLWVVFERKPGAALGPSEPERWIGCFLMNRLRTPDFAGWGKKPMDESMGPVEVTCPLVFLDMVPDPGHYATEWRARVRAYRAGLSRPLAVGTRLLLPDSTPPALTVASLRPLRGRDDSGGFWKIPRRILATAVVEGAA